MNLSEYYVGMRVVMIEDNPEAAGIVGDRNRDLHNGMTGIVRLIDERRDKAVGVEWDLDHESERCHRLSDTLKEKRGWWCSPEQLAPESEEIEPSELDFGFLIGGDAGA